MQPGPELVRLLAPRARALQRDRQQHGAVGVQSAVLGELVLLGHLARLQRLLSGVRLVTIDGLVAHRDVPVDKVVAHVAAAVRAVLAALRSCDT